MISNEREKGRYLEVASKLMTYVHQNIQRKWTMKRHPCTWWIFKWDIIFPPKAIKTTITWYVTHEACVILDYNGVCNKIQLSYCQGNHYLSRHNLLLPHSDKILPSIIWLLWELLFTGQNPLLGHSDTIPPSINNNNINVLPEGM